MNKAAFFHAAKMLSQSQQFALAYTRNSYYAHFGIITKRPVVVYINGVTRMWLRRRLGGLMLVSAGGGMLLVLLIPGWGFVLAGGMVIVGLYILFF
jgi:hypothetical protein